MMKHLKHTVIVLLLIILSSIALACSNDTALEDYRQTKKQEIQTYATTKLQDSYSEENHSKINEVIATCNKSIVGAKNTDEVNSIIIDAKQQLDIIEPAQSAPLKDGAYFITDASFEWYNAHRYPLQGNADQHYIWALVVGNQITIDNSRRTAYTIADNNGIYHGASFVSYDNVDIWMINDTLYIRDSYKVLSYKVDSDYDTSTISQTEQLTTPSDISFGYGDIKHVSFSWPYSYKYGDFGCGVEIKNSEYTDFTPIQIEYPWMNKMVVDSLHDYLKPGENLIRIHNLGGYSITNDKRIFAYVRSDYVTFRVFVTDNTATAEQIDTGKIIRLEEAYDNGLLTTKDLQDIAYYMGCAGDADYSPTPKNPETLDGEIALKIKYLYLKDWRDLLPQLTVNDVIVTDYYGTYGSCIAVCLSNEIAPCDYIFEDEHYIGGVTFYNYCGAFVSIIIGVI